MPDLETAEMETPDVDTEIDDAPEAESPEVETSAVDVDATEAEAPEAKVDTTEVDTVEIETVDAEEPIVEEAVAEGEPEARDASDVEADEAVPLVPASPYDMAGDWYVIHSYSGYENKVKANLETRIQSMHMEDRIFEVSIPLEPWSSSKAVGR